MLLNLKNVFFWIFYSRGQIIIIRIRRSQSRKTSCRRFFYLYENVKLFNIENIAPYLRELIPPFLQTTAIHLNLCHICTLFKNQVIFLFVPTLIHKICLNSLLPFYTTKFPLTLHFIFNQTIYESESVISCYSNFIYV